MATDATSSKPKCRRRSWPGALPPYPHILDQTSPMPALNAPVPTKPVLGHVNLMVDTLIANASVDDLRAIVRTMLASSPPTVAASFTSAARSRLRHKRPSSNRVALFRSLANKQGTLILGDGSIPTPELTNLLSHARSLYGAGMGFDSIEILTNIVRATIGLRWGEDGPLVDILAVIDSDISQGIQSCREELGAGNVADMDKARSIIRNLLVALVDCQREVESWGGEFPFEKGIVNAEALKC